MGVAKKDLPCQSLQENSSHVPEESYLRSLHSDEWLQIQGLWHFPLPNVPSVCAIVAVQESILLIVEQDI